MFICLTLLINFFFMSKKILVTGANGFLGSSITKLAVKKGFKVNVLIRKDSNADNLKNIFSKINVFYGDIRDYDSIHDAVNSSDIIFHVAADYRLWAKKNLKFILQMFMEQKILH